jgi:hypothetical protein
VYLNNSRTTSIKAMQTPFYGGCLVMSDVGKLNM